MFKQVYNIHRSPYFWDRPNVFEPERFSMQKNSDIEGWAGFDPSRNPGAYYPNEVSVYQSHYHNNSFLFDRNQNMCMLPTVRCSDLITSKDQEFLL